MDDYIGRIVAQLKAAGVYEDAAIIISADHGENLDKLGLYAGPAAARSARCKPLTLRANLAATTQQPGFISTVSTTYNEPTQVTRKFGSLDQFTGGRIGGNLVTSNNSTEVGKPGIIAYPPDRE
jgi:alkanesulfonate monooxygenase SsuD/methylene tetrahydromethanopterin reductase-like flavin-dependent oxidoreductase (luciferase family)